MSHNVHATAPEGTGDIRTAETDLDEATTFAGGTLIDILWP
jgi:hypothetical protein